MKHLLVAAAMVLTAGTMTACARMPTQDELSHLDYGQPVSQQSAEDQAKSYMERHLKDPYSAVYTWQPVATGWVKAPPILGGGIDAGWVLKGTVNAKNSFGGYVGVRPYRFMFNNGSLTHVWSQDAQTGVMMKDM
jgi:hypothetical protein